MFKEIRNLVAFLTILPVGVDQDCLRDAADYMPFFPLIGAFIGSFAGVFGWLLLQILPELVAGTLTLSLILLITGLHHTDGLLDLGDGLMYQGPAQKKIEVMHDQRTGTGGLLLGIMISLATAFSIAGLRRSIVIQSLIISEVSAKLAMVFGASVGKSAHEGMNTLFVDGMHGKYRGLRLAVALIISFGIALPLFGAIGFITLITGQLASLIMVGVSSRHFGGVTGDVIGAMNEIVRTSSLITILMVTRWV